MSKNILRTKVSLQLLLAVIISFILAFIAGTAFAAFVANNLKYSDFILIALMMFSFVIGIGVFILVFLLIIHRKVNYLKYVSKKVQEIASEGFGGIIEIKGYDEIATLCGNINYMSRELKRKFDYEREIERSKNELISSVSHDLRTPLTSIKGYIKLLKDKQYQSPGEMENYIDVAFSQTETLERLIEELFEYTRLSGSDIKLNYQKLCINDILRQVAIDHSPLFRGESLALQVDIPEEKFFVQIDPGKFVRVIENLLGNALKYSVKPGEVRVILVPDNQGVRMTVSNRGQFINAASLEHLFDRFYRLEKSRSKETGGTGLGLAIAKSIVELHGGRIWAESEGEIISFHVWLPL